MERWSKFKPAAQEALRLAEIYAEGGIHGLYASRASRREIRLVGEFMRGMEGFTEAHEREALRALRARRKTRGVTVVTTTGSINRPLLDALYLLSQPFVAVGRNEVRCFADSQTLSRIRKACLGEVFCDPRRPGGKYWTGRADVRAVLDVIVQERKDARGQGAPTDPTA